MRTSVIAGSALAVALLVGCADAADGLKSGPQVGDKVDVFEPLYLTGPSAGMKRCPVWQNGPKPVVMVFAREISDPLTSLVKKVNEVNKEQGSIMGSFVVFLSDDEAVEKQLKALAEKEKLEKTILMLDNPAGPSDYKIDKKADVTVILYVGKKVKVNRAYKKGEFKTDEVDKVLKDLPKILEPEK